MTETTPSLAERERSQKLVVLTLTALLVGFAVWCALLFWRAHSLRQQLEVKMASIEEASRLHGELDGLRLDATDSASDRQYDFMLESAERLIRQSDDDELQVAVQSLAGALEHLHQSLTGQSSADEVWEAAVTARSAVSTVEGRIQNQITRFHDRLGNLWTGVYLLIGASLVLAGSNLGLLRLAHRRRLELEQAHLEALRRATQDPLTGVWNRDAIRRLLHREIARAERHHAPLGVILADIDDFQQINVMHGQDQGDFILEQLAERLGAFVRPYDTLGRFGGDAFMLVLPSCDETATGNVASRLREAVNERDVEHALGRARVSISLAYATVEDPEEVDADHLIHRLQDRVEAIQSEAPGNAARLDVA
ncbi:MAG: GGDEF domain-containing protein [Acidobacteriota bacterium]